MMMMSCVVVVCHLTYHGVIQALKQEEASPQLTDHDGDVEASEREGYDGEQDIGADEQEARAEGANGGEG